MSIGAGNPITLALSFIGIALIYTVYNLSAALKEWGLPMALDLAATQIPSEKERNVFDEYKEYCVSGGEASSLNAQRTKYNVLVTGGAGFVGMHTSLELKRLGHPVVVSYDNINSYYSTALKHVRIDKQLEAGIKVVKGDVCDKTFLKSTIIENKIERIIHLAAQAGVRYSLEHPFEYTKNNIDCTVQLLEVLVEIQKEQITSNQNTTTTHNSHIKTLLEKPIVYASSSSVYGYNTKIPFSEYDNVDNPASLYATTKRSDELITRTYYNLYGITSVGLRFFTVYGPMGRPDMAYYSFTNRIDTNQTIKVYNFGKMKRDFTFIDDIVNGVISSLYVSTSRPEIINLGNNKPVQLSHFIKVIESSLNKKAQINNVGMQQGDVPMTYANIDKATCLLGYKPKISIEEGLSRFIIWYKNNNGNQYAN